MLWALLLVSPAPADPPDVRFAGGGQAQNAGNGILDLGVRGDHWSAELQTDTLDLRWRHEGQRGKAWAAMRGAGFAAGLFINPWTDGAPDPGRALTAGYVGPEAGVQRYLDSGLWIGAQGHARYSFFSGRPATTVDVPEPALWLRADAVAGLWRNDGVLQARLRIGLDADPIPFGEPQLSPHLFFDGAWRPVGPLVPWVALHVGLAEEQDDLTRTRVGGMTPYDVPLAGAAWFEFWAEDYVVSRTGFRADSERGWAGATLDAGTVGGGVWGLAAHAGWTWSGWQVDGSVAWGGGVPRQDGVSPLSLYVLFERGWAPLGDRQ